METLKIKTKTGTEFAIDFDNIQDIIDFIISYTDQESTSGAHKNIAGVLYDNQML